MLLLRSAASSSGRQSFLLSSSSLWSASSVLPLGFGAYRRDAVVGSSMSAPILQAASSVRLKHYKTRPVQAHVKAQRVERIESRPLPGTEREREKLAQQNSEELLDWDAEYEDPEQVLGNAELYYDAVAEEEARARARLRNLLIYREENPYPPESNLLYWAAKQQIHYLHRRDPLEWSPQRIAEEFPISEVGAKRLLKSKFLIEPDDVSNHDAQVDARWMLLKKIRRKGKCPTTGPVTLHKRTIELYLEGKLQNEAFKAGSPEFPRPPPTAGIRVPIRIGQEGEHFAMLQEYRCLLDKPDMEQSTREEIVLQNRNFEELQPPSSEQRLSYALRRDRKTAGDDDDDDPEAATRLDLPENFRMRFVSDFSGSGNINLETFKKQQAIADPPALAGDDKSVAKKPKKKNLQKRAKIEQVPKYRQEPRLECAEKRDDGTYQIDRNVYAADGELLFRIRR